MFLELGGQKRPLLTDSVRSTLSMRSMLLPAGSGDMPPPGKFRKIDALRLHLRAFLPTFACSYSSYR